MKAELKYVMVVSGDLCVLVRGTIMMLKLYVDNQNILQLVSYIFGHFTKTYFAGAAPFTTFEKGIGPVHFSDFSCSGNETNLLNCTYYTYSLCYYSYHAGVKCEGNSDTLL